MIANRKFAVTSALVVLSMMLISYGCTDRIRRSGQVELFRLVDSNGRNTWADNNGSPCTVPNSYDILSRKFADDEDDLGRLRYSVIPDFGDFARFPEDTITIQILSVYLEKFPNVFRFGKKDEDAVLIVDIWEDAAKSAPDNPNITSVVFVAKDQTVPGRINFTGHLGYGPASFKVRPLKMRCTLMLVRKQKAEGRANAVDVVSKYAAVIPTYGALSAPIAGVIRDILLSQPDVIAFDFEATLLPYKPTRTNGRVESEVAEAESTLERLNLPVSGPLVVTDNSRKRTLDERLFVLERKVEAARTHLEVLKQQRKRVEGKIDEFQKNIKDLQERNKDVLEKINSRSTSLSKNEKELEQAREDESKKDEYQNKKKELEFQLDNSISIKRNIDSEMRTVERACGKFERLRNEKNWAARQKSQIPWIRYGLYALVESARRPEPVSPGAGEADLEPSPPRISHPNEKLKYEYFHKDGRLYICDTKSSCKTPEPLAENYMVFSITPGQLQTNDEELRVASEASRRLLNDLSRSPNDVKIAINNATKHAEDLKVGLYKSRASALASRIARSTPDNCAAFMEAFDYQWKSSMAGLSGTDNLTTTISEEIKSGWKSLFMELGDNVVCSTAK